MIQNKDVVKTQFILFVIHYSKFTKRFNYLKERLQEYNLKTIWITENNYNSYKHMSSKIKKLYGVSRLLVGMDLGINSRSLKFSRRMAKFQGYILLLRSIIQRKPSLVLGSMPKEIALPLSMQEVQLMHFTAIKSGVESQVDWIVILEDDAVISSEFTESLNWIFQKFKSNEKIWINLNSGAGLKRTSSDPLPDSKGFFRVKPSSTRCCVAYVISKSLAIHIHELTLNYGVPNWMPIDYTFQVMLRALKAKSFWQDPPSVLQGSEIGKYESGFEKFRN